MTASWAKEVGFGSAVSNKYGRIVVARYRPKTKPKAVVSGSTRQGGMKDESSKHDSNIKADDDSSKEPGRPRQWATKGNSRCYSAKYS